MHCPYCNAPNSERATFCSHCGRDLTPSARTAQPSQSSPASQPSQQPARTTQPYSPPSPYPQRPPTQPAYPTNPTQPQRSAQARPTPLPPTQATRPTPTTRVPEPVKAPEPPAPFPPRTLEHLQALEQGALAYAVIDEVIGNGRNRTIRISYRACSPWQQVATLLKAFKEQQSDKFDTIIVQGIVTNTALPYAFNNGQFRYDHNVRLGSQLINRYVIETGTGLESDSLRIVLQDPGT